MEAYDTCCQQKNPDISIIANLWSIMSGNINGMNT